MVFPSENILYIALLLNKSMIDVNKYNISSLIPTIELPELPIDLRFENELFFNVFINDIFHALQSLFSIL